MCNHIIGSLLLLQIYVHLQYSTNGEDTLEANKLFKAYSRSKGVKILYYHVDNGRFVECTWMEHVKQHGQKFSYCAAYSHFQNGKAENRIRNLQEQARKIILHAISCWSQAVNTHIWLYALRHVNDIKTTISDSPDGSSPISIFTQVYLPPTLGLYHTFEYPIYSFSIILQNSSSIHKWSSRETIGIYLGTSP